MHNGEPAGGGRPAGASGRREAGGVAGGAGGVAGGAGGAGGGRRAEPGRDDRLPVHQFRLVGRQPVG